MFLPSLFLAVRFHASFFFFQNLLFAVRVLGSSVWFFRVSSLQSLLMSLLNLSSESLPCSPFSFLFVCLFRSLFLAVLCCVSSLIVLENLFLGVRLHIYV